MRHEQLRQADSFDLVDVAAIWPNGAALGAPLGEIERAVGGTTVRGEAALADMPVAAGKALIAAYAGLMGAFVLTMAKGGEASFAIAISGFYVAMFLGVPALFLHVERRPERRPALANFLEQGMDTATGYISGAGALIQMLIVPVLLTMAILAIGTIALVIL
jgi:hypothetical protein